VCIKYKKGFNDRVSNSGVKQVSNLTKKTVRVFSNSTGSGHHQGVRKNGIGKNLE